MNPRRWDVLHGRRQGRAEVQAGLPGGTELQPASYRDLQRPAHPDRPPVVSGFDRFAGFFARGDVTIVEVLSCLAALGLGYICLRLGADPFSSPWFSVIGVALVVLGPLNLILSILLRAPPQDEANRQALVALKVLTMVLLIPLLSLVLLVTALVVAALWSMAHSR